MTNVKPNTVSIIILPILESKIKEEHWAIEMLELIGNIYKTEITLSNYYEIKDENDRYWSIPKYCAEIIVPQQRKRRIRWYHNGKLSEKMNFEDFKV